MTEHRAITLLREYDERKRELRALEEELNRECFAYGRDVLRLWGFSPNHLRQRLAAQERVKLAAKVRGSDPSNPPVA